MNKKYNDNYRNLTEFSGFFDFKELDKFILGYSFIFVTKPNLFIKDTQGINENESLAYRNLQKDPFFASFIPSENKEDRVLVNMLSAFPDISIYSSNFLKIFTNEIGSFDNNGTSMETGNFFETRDGYFLPLPLNKTQSEGSSSIPITIKEDLNLNITKLMGLWVNYIENISNGTFIANPEMIKSGSLDFTSSIFFFTLQPDGKTLKYWSKYSGCFPTTIPSGDISYSKGSKSDFEARLNFVYTIKEELTTDILIDFNKISLKMKESLKDLKDNINLSRCSAFDKSFISKYSNRSPREPFVFYDSERGEFTLEFGQKAYEDSFQYEKFDKDHDFLIKEY